MIFLDESGVDKGNSKNSPFFIVSIVNLFNYKEENKKIREFLKHKQERLKWQKLTKSEKDLFLSYSENINYKVYAIYNNKNLKSITYFDILYHIMNNRIFNKQKIIYSGLHLNSIFEKVRRALKKENKILISFKESENDEEFGIQIADLWAGFINNSLKNKIDISGVKNLDLTCYK